MEKFKNWSQVPVHLKSKTSLSKEGLKLSKDQNHEAEVYNLKGQTIFDSLIYPLKDCSEEASAIHGISQEMLESAPKWSEIWSEIKETVKDKIILIFNSEFDERMIDQTCAATGVESMELNTICIMDLVMQYEETKYWTSLSNAVGYCVDHRAKADCLAVLDLLKQITLLKVE